jgi:hypothetical protein
MKDIPAFPVPSYVNVDGETHDVEFKGMGLRDYFAAQAMTAVMPAVISELKKTRGSVKEAIRLQALSAETCYAVADAMIKARSEA